MSKILQAAASSGLQTRYLTLRHASLFPPLPSPFTFSLQWPVQEWAWGCLSKKTCWLIEWNHFVLILVLDFSCLFKWCFFWPCLAFQPRDISELHVVTHQQGHLLPPPPPHRSPTAIPTLVLGVQDQREIVFKLQMKKQGWPPLMSGSSSSSSSSVIYAPDLLLLPCNLQLRCWV